MAFDRLAPELQRETVGVEWVETPEAGVVLANKSRYDVIIMDAEPAERPLEDVIRELRASGSLSRAAAVLILVEPTRWMRCGRSRATASTGSCWSAILRRSFVRR